MIKVWGHRGHRHYRYPEKYPDNQPYENSLLAYRQALQACMGLECDLIQSKNGTIYLAHGTHYDANVCCELRESLDPLSQEIIGKNYIYQLDDMTVAQLRLLDGQIMPSLQTLFEMMKGFPNKTLNLELKGPITADIVLATVDKAVKDKWIKPEQIVLSSFYFHLLEDVRAKAGDRYKIGALFDLTSAHEKPMYPNWPDAPQEAHYIPFRLEDGILNRPDIKAINPDFFNIERGSLSAFALEEIKQHYPSAKIIIWTSREPHPEDDMLLATTIAEYAGTNMIEAVITDFPAEVQAQLSRLGIDVELP